jgi:aquaporin Z
LVIFLVATLTLPSQLDFGLVAVLIKKELLPYIGAQVLGGIAGAGILYLIASGKPGFEIGGFAANGYGDHSPGGYGMQAALITEVVMTFMFLFIILGATHSKAPKGLAGIAIGLG